MCGGKGEGRGVSSPCGGEGGMCHHRVGEGGCHHRVGEGRGVSSLCGGGGGCHHCVGEEVGVITVWGRRGVSSRYLKFFMVHRPVVCCVHMPFPGYMYASCPTPPRLLVQVPGKYPV